MARQIMNNSNNNDNDDDNENNVAPILKVANDHDPPRTAAMDADDLINASVDDFLPKCQTEGKPGVDKDSFFRM